MAHAHHNTTQYTQGSPGHLSSHFFFTSFSTFGGTFTGGFPPIFKIMLLRFPSWSGIQRHLHRVNDRWMDIVSQWATGLYANLSTKQNSQNTKGWEHECGNSHWEWRELSSRLKRCRFDVSYSDSSVGERAAYGRALDAAGGPPLAQLAVTTKDNDTRDSVTWIRKFRGL